MSDTKLLERAYEIARSGQVGNVDELIVALAREGYRQLEAHFTYSSLRRELNAICRAAWAAAGNPQLADPRRRKTGVGARGRRGGPTTAAEVSGTAGRPADEHE